MLPSLQHRQHQCDRIRMVMAVWILLPVSLLGATSTSLSRKTSTTITTTRRTQSSSKQHNNAVDASEPYYTSLQGRLKLMRRCESSIVYVNRIYLTCDSPGGEPNEEPSSGTSGGYQQSSRCKYGDQANAYIFFSLSQNYNGDGIEFTIDSGVLDSFVNVQPRTNLCTMGSITYISGTNTNMNNDLYVDDDTTLMDDNSLACLTPGTYQLHWTFVVPKGGGDDQLQYTPDMRIKFYATGTNVTLGCAGAGTMATVQQAALHMKEGEIALGVALAALFGIFAVCLCMAYQRKKLVESAHQQEEDGWHGKRISLTRPASTVDMDLNESQEGGAASYVLDEEYESESRQTYRSDSHHRYHHEQQQQHDDNDEDDDLHDTSLRGPQHRYYYHDHDHPAAASQYEYSGTTTSEASYSLSSRKPTQRQPRQQQQQQRHHHSSLSSYPPTRDYVHHDYDEEPPSTPPRTDSSIPFVVDISSLDGQSYSDSGYWNPPSPVTAPKFAPSLRKKF